MTVNQALLAKLEGQKSVLATSSMDGPSVPFAPNDLFKFNNKMFMLYHVMGSGYDYLTPIGCLVGAATIPLFPKYQHFTRLQAAGTGAIIAGCTGMGLGALAMASNMAKTEPKLPFDKAGWQQRVDGLSHNYRVRAMDVGVWLGVVAGATAVTYCGGPKALNLSPGILGTLQSIALGSAGASILTNLFIVCTK
jgi:hypothetical protein